MRGPEGYHHPPTEYAHPVPLSHDSSEQLHPSSDLRNQKPAVTREQPSAIDLDAAGVSLSGMAQYMRELRLAARLPPEAEPQVIAQARQGDQVARHRLIEDRLPYIVHMANIYHVYAEHEDLLDIVGVANLAVTANIDKALAKENPTAYLCGVAKREIRNYCFYHSRLMPIKDRRMPFAEAPKVVSLDERRADVQYHYLGSLAQDSTPETGNARREQLRQALDQLPDIQRQVVELHHGMHGSACGFTEIAHILAISRPMAYQRYRQALERLREVVPEKGLPLGRRDE